MPSEYGSYVFDARQPFTTVVAASGGYYAEISTNADPHYNATGLQRVHRRGVELSPLTDSAAAERAIGGMKTDPRAALAPGVQWKGDYNRWVSLADFNRFEPPPKPKPGTTAPAAEPQRIVKQTDLTVDDAAASPQQVKFTLRYTLDGPDARAVTEQYDLSSAGVRCRQDVEGGANGTLRLVFPALVNDGARDTKITDTPGRLTITRAGGTLDLTVIDPPRLTLKLDGPRLVTHHGYVQPAAAQLPPGSGGAEYKIQLSPAPLATK
jgi:hypothetical protein